jgi:putative lipoprotein
MNMPYVATFSVILCILVACSSGVPDDGSATGADIPSGKEEVTGTLMYRERVTLPPGAFAEVWLLDTSLADAPAVEIAYLRIDDPGSPPIPFALDYDPAKIREGMQYTVRATIRHADRLLYTSDTHYPVLTRGAGTTADIVLVPVKGDR